jgi:hypothetical protein
VLGSIHLRKGCPREGEGGTHDSHKVAKKSRKVSLYATPSVFLASPHLNSVTGHFKYRFSSKLFDGRTVAPDFDKLDMLVELARTAV